MAHPLQAARDALATLFPVSCAGCGARDAGVCEACRRELRAACAPEVGMLGSLPLASAAHYGDRLRLLADAYKERGRVDVATVLAPLLRASLLALLRSLPGWPSEPVLVAVPSRRAARAARGFDHVQLLLERAVGQPGVAGLAHARKVGDQAALSREQRAENLAGALRARPELRGANCIVVDDFATTGSTLLEAQRALEAAGAQVLGAAVVARVIKHNTTSANS
ncbi:MULTISPECIES: ComF family protein [Gulosibacter]|uniref:ComF family protein n=1 Tax=Gulosibacter TaxID=256818 RepID=UPI000F63D623|nr:MULTISPECIES: phosphoribosyltransferase family protein [Gulosibacter]